MNVTCPRASTPLVTSPVRAQFEYGPTYLQSTLRRTIGIVVFSHHMPCHGDLKAVAIIIERIVCIQKDHIKIDIYSICIF